MGRKLKNYDLYLDKLHMYASGIGIKIILKEADGEAWYDLNKVVVCEDLKESTKIASILHELGHALDSVLHNEPTCRTMNRAYSKIYTDNYTEKQHELVKEAELRAWESGELLAKRLKIKLGKWFYNYRKICLQAYSRV